MILPWRRWEKTRQHPAVRWPFLCFVSYLVVLVLLSWFENSLVFPRWAIPPADWEPLGLDFEEAHFSTEDGVRLHGWYFPHPEPRAYVLYCHGNGTNVGHMGPDMQALSRSQRISILAFDYRGYGLSQGQPSEQGLYRDAAAAQVWLAQRANLRPEDLLIMGRSLGGAVAVDLAVARGARGLVLERTFPSIPDVAAGIYWWLPVRWLMRNRFDSFGKIGRYRGPLLQSHGTADSVVPFGQGKKLFEAVPSDHKRFIVLPHVEHNDLDPDEYWHAFDEFLDTLPPVASGL